MASHLAGLEAFDTPACIVQVAGSSCKVGGESIASQGPKWLSAIGGQGGQRAQSVGGWRIGRKGLGISCMAGRSDGKSCA
jgi:hypothetical protein